MSDIENYIDADGQPVQPYFAAFMIEKGYSRAKHIFERDGHGLEYMEWNQARWKEFETENGYPVDHFTRNSRAPEFKQWLANRVSEAAA